MTTPLRRPLALAATVAVLACTDGARPLGPPSARPLAAATGGQGARRLVLFGDESVPDDFAARVAALGGRVDGSLDEIGVATVTELSDDAASVLAADPRVTAVEVLRTPDAEDAGDVAVDDAPVPATADALPRDASDLPSPALATLYPRQWNLRAIHADEAWSAGYLGWTKARVAIMDSGIDYLNPEVAGLVDMESSRSFSNDDAATKAMYPDREPFTDLFWHGTADASLIASAARELAGVNQQATLFAVKMVNASGALTTDGLDAISWAVKQRADVLSFAGGVAVDTAASHALYVAYVRAFEYAWRKGAVSVAPAGDNGADKDVARRRGRYAVPCDMPHVMCVSITGPDRKAPTPEGPWTNVDWSPPSASFGSDVTVAAPGGTAFANTRIWLTCTTSPGPSTPDVCKPGSATYRGKIQGVGTSWSSATVAGLAAALVTKYGHNHPDLIRQRIIDTADDFGGPGFDVRYGWGRVNMARALDVPIRRGRN